MTVPVSTENCALHAPQRHTRRADDEPVRVTRVEPFFGFSNQHFSTLPQWGQTGRSPHLEAERAWRRAAPIYDEIPAIHRAMRAAVQRGAESHVN